LDERIGDAFAPMNVVNRVWICGRSTVPISAALNSQYQGIANTIV